MKERIKDGHNTLIYFTSNQQWTDFFSCTYEAYACSIYISFLVKFFKKIIKILQNGALHVGLLFIFLTRLSVEVEA